MNRQAIVEHISAKEDLWEKSFKDIQAMLLTIGFPGSGSSLIGYLLTAHPNLVIADEPAIEHQGDSVAQDINDINGIAKQDIENLYLADLNKLFNIIFSLDHVRWLMAKQKNSLSKDEAVIARGSREERYVLVPDQYQGRFESPKVIGIKHSYHNVRCLSNKTVLENFKKRLEERGISLKFIVMVRNPYDMISLRARKLRSDKQTVKNGMRFIKNLSMKNMEIREQIHPKDVFISRHEDMLENPDRHLAKLCDFLQVPVAPDYLDSCASCVVRDPHKRRFEFDWTPEQKQKVASLIEKYDFLSGYDWES